MRQGHGAPLQCSVPGQEAERQALVPSLLSLSLLDLQPDPGGGAVYIHSESPLLNQPLWRHTSRDT